MRHSNLNTLNVSTLPARALAASTRFRTIFLSAVGAASLIACGGTEPAQAPTDDSAPPTENADSAGPEEAAAGETEEQGSAAPASAAAQSSGVKIAGDGTDAEIGFNSSKNAHKAHGVSASQLKATKTEAAMRFFIVDKAKADSPIEGIVISMTAPDGQKFYTKETDAKGYAEVLVPVGQTYELAYLSLGRKTITAKIPVTSEPNQNIKLTLRYERWTFEPKQEKSNIQSSSQIFVLAGINFDTGKATIRPESLPRLDGVLEYMTHKEDVRIEIAGHTDNVGNPAANKDLSQRRADACRDYLVSKGINKDRIETVGYGDERPVAPNDSAEGRQQNRRIEAKEL